MSSTTHLRWVTVALALALADAAGAGWSAQIAPGAAAAGRAFAAVSVFDVAGRSWMMNPALIGWRRATAASIEHVRWYGLPELTTDCASLELPRVPVALGVMRFGSKLYRETSVSFASAWRNNDLRVGVGLRVGQTTIARYGQRRGIAVDIALLSTFSGTFVVSVAGRNVFAAGDRAWVESLDRSLTVCLAGRVTARAAIAADLSKDPFFPAEGRIGLEFRPLSLLLLRAGVTVNPPRTTLGFRLTLSRLYFDYAFVRHSVLGGTHFVGLTFVSSQISPPR